MKGCHDKIIAGVIDHRKRELPQWTDAMEAYKLNYRVLSQGKNIYINMFNFDSLIKSHFNVKVPYV